MMMTFGNCNADVKCLLKKLESAVCRQYVFFFGGCSHGIFLDGLGLRKLLVQETCAVPFFCQKIMLRHAFLKNTDAWLDRHQFCRRDSCWKKTRKWMNPRKQICSFGWYQSWYLDWFGEFQHLAHPKIHSSWVFCKNPKDLLTNLGDPICRNLGGYCFFGDADPWILPWEFSDAKWTKFRSDGERSGEQCVFFLKIIQKRVPWMKT